MDRLPTVLNLSTHASGFAHSSLRSLCSVELFLIVDVSLTVSIVSRSQRNFLKFIFNVKHTEPICGLMYFNYAHFYLFFASVSKHWYFSPFFEAEQELLRRKHKLQRMKKCENTVWQISYLNEHEVEFL